MTGQKRTGKDKAGQDRTTPPLEERIQRAFARIATLEQETPQKGAAPTPDRRILDAIAPRVAALVAKGWSVRRIGAALEQDGVMPAARFVRLWSKRNAEANGTDARPKAGKGDAANSAAHAAQAATSGAIEERARQIAPGDSTGGRTDAVQATGPVRREGASQAQLGQ